MHRPHSRRASDLLQSAAFWTCVIAFLTLTPVSGPPLPPRLCIICGDRGLADILANIVLYLPLGLCLSRARTRLRFVFPILLSFTIEFAQHFIPGRNASLSDVLFNSTGGVLGIWLGSHAQRWWNSSARAARVWFALSMTIVLAILFLTAFLVTPAPTDENFFAHWTPDLRQFEQYDGRLLSATIGTASLPAGMLPNSHAVRAAIVHDSALHITGIAGAPTHSLAPLFSVTDQWSRQMFLVGIDGPDLVYHYRSRAALWYLDMMELRARGLTGGLQPGGALDVKVEPGPRGLLFVVNGKQELLRAPHLGMGWRLLGGSHPLPGVVKGALDYLWVLLLMLPLGYWSRGAGAAVIATALVLAALWLLPLWSWLAPTPAGVYLAAVLGVIVGRAAGRLYPPRPREAGALS